MALSYVTVKEFWDAYGLTESILDFQPEDTPSREIVAETTVSAGVYYLDQKCVNEDTLKLYVGSSDTELTEDTDYTFDSDTSAVTITATGSTTLAGENLTATYEYCSLSTLTYNLSVKILEAAEREIERDTEQRFTTVSDANYLQITNEIPLFNKQTIRMKNGFCTKYNPLVELETTVDGDYTSGGTTITLVDASGFPSSGTIYIGGNKVSYTAIDGNELTVPSSTPSIDDGALVSNFVVEVSLESEGNSPDWDVIDYKQDYEVDFYQGYVKILSSAYFNQYTEGDINLYPDNPKVRFTYMQAWHEDGQDPEIPDDLYEVILQIAARNLRRKTVFRSHINQKNNFNPTTSTESIQYIKDFKEEYMKQEIDIR